jgi:protein-tyrosine phosphatase
LAQRFERISLWNLAQVGAMTGSVLFVCLGNICRSPIAEGVMRQLLCEDGEWAHDLVVDSAGIGDWHAGEAPDRRARRVCEQEGFRLDGQRARQIRAADFARYDLILGMDQENLRELHRLAPPNSRARLGRLRDFDPQGQGDVPDPYYGNERDFQDVFDLVIRCCESLRDALRAERQ